ncbi:prepilin-type N-terminal cleavage/methylation domain-containing protein [Couchioplanes caeruleus]|uniref:type II secretion system protein n=1 Tax=Couchioplanes caeruleus TaxID=56438 RepID=UPI0020BEEA2D|nr:prepilin-type N-terminal cleavage/methylation domain-containing protein [Couchioplanes caeruleus]UQU63872.1 prepilin-type N-terminal cleavage/methylation domain-containing protein [Couchioplanes caeruleus]
MQDIISRLRAKKDDEGFTLIELLVVVVIIGVLVAIAVPVYLNYRQGAADKSAQSDVRGAISAVEQYYTDNGNTYPAGFASQSSSPQTIGGQKITLSDKTVMTLTSTTTSATYKICAYNTGGTDKKYYVYDSAAGGSVSGKVYASFSMTDCTGS